MVKVEIHELKEGDRFSFKDYYYFVCQEMSGQDITNGKVMAAHASYPDLESEFPADTLVTRI